jgi:hypothetical protein
MNSDGENAEKEDLQGEESGDTEGSIGLPHSWMIYTWKFRHIYG